MFTKKRLNSVQETMKWKVACHAGEFPRSSSFMK